MLANQTIEEYWGLLSSESLFQRRATPTETPITLNSVWRSRFLFCFRVN